MDILISKQIVLVVDNNNIKSNMGFVFVYAKLGNITLNTKDFLHHLKTNTHLQKELTSIIKNVDFYPTVYFSAAFKSDATPFFMVLDKSDSQYLAKPHDDARRSMVECLSKVVSGSNTLLFLARTSSQAGIVAYLRPSPLVGVVQRYNTIRHFLLSASEIEIRKFWEAHCECVLSYVSGTRSGGVFSYYSCKQVPWLHLKIGSMKEYYKRLGDVFDSLGVRDKHLHPNTILDTLSLQPKKISLQDIATTKTTSSQARTKKVLKSQRRLLF